MDIYADNLAKALQSSRITVGTFLPTSYLERFAGLPLVMRLLRYLHYPWLVRAKQAHIHHILDHGYAHLLPRLGAGKKCITVHDLIPYLHWKGHLQPVGDVQKPRRPWLNQYSLSYLKHFDRIIADSQCTADDLVNHLDIDREKIEVIAPIISDLFKPVSDKKVFEFTERYQLDRSCKWIMVSGQEFYKNHRISLQVLKDLAEHHHSKIMLIKTGRPSADFDAVVQELELQHLVKTVFLEDQQELPILYSFIDCLLFPSLYEGFGMPVAEALACGTPVVVSDRGSLPEVGGEIAPALNPYDIKGLSRMVYRMMFDDGARAFVRLEGPKWVRQFRAEAIAPQMEALYQEMVSDT